MHDRAPARLALFALGAALLVAGCPDPTRGSIEATSAADAGAAGGGQGGQASAGKHVLCTVQSQSCDDGLVCCVGDTISMCDHCAASASACGAKVVAPACEGQTYAALECTTNADCPGTTCCARPGATGARPLAGSRCAAECAGAEVVLCATPNDCGPGEQCVPLGYPGYAACQ